MHAVVLGAGATDAPTFVLVHALGMSSRYMMPTADLLSAHGTVYAPDLRGFGLSDKPPQPLAISALEVSQVSSDRLKAGHSGFVCPTVNFASISCPTRSTSRWRPEA